jgi:large subunit ribosomal protein L21
MFAVVRTGGKQYKVAQKDRLEVPKIDAKEGASIDLEVLMTSDGKGASIGEKGAKVSAKVIEHTRADKIVVFKKKRRQNYRRTQGHRQDLTVIEIADIKTA